MAEDGHSSAGTAPNRGHVASVGLLSMEGMVGARDYD